MPETLEAELLKKIYDAAQPSVKLLGTSVSSIAASTGKSIRDYKSFQHKVKIAEIAKLECQYAALKAEINGHWKGEINGAINMLRRQLPTLKKLKGKDKVYEWKSDFVTLAERAKRDLIHVGGIDDKMQILKLKIANIAESAIRELKKAKKDAGRTGEDTVTAKLAGEKHKIELSYLDAEIQMLSRYSKELDARTASYMRYRREEKMALKQIDDLIRKVKVIRIN